LGVARRSLKKDYAWKKKAIDPARWRRSIKFLRTTRGPVERREFVLVLQGWIQRSAIVGGRFEVGIRRSRSMISSSRPEAAAARSKGASEQHSASNIFFGRTEAFLAERS